MKTFPPNDAPINTSTRGHWLFDFNHEALLLLQSASCEWTFVLWSELKYSARVHEMNWDTMFLEVLVWVFESTGEVAEEDNSSIPTEDAACQVS